MKCPGDMTWEIYLDDEVNETEKKALERHLDGCRDCRERVAFLEEEAGLWRMSLSATPLPAGLETHIRHSVKYGGAADIRLIRVIIPLAILAGLLTLPAVGLWGLMEGALSFFRLMGGAALLPNTMLLAAAIVKSLAGASLRGGVALPALLIILFCLSWIKLKLRNGGHVHA